MFHLLILFSRFGWTNASIIHGLSLLGDDAKRALGKCVPYEVYNDKAKSS